MVLGSLVAISSERPGLDEFLEDEPGIVELRAHLGQRAAPGPDGPVVWRAQGRFDDGDVKYEPPRRCQSAVGWVVEMTRAPPGVSTRRNSLNIASRSST